MMAFLFEQTATPRSVEGINDQLRRHIYQPREDAARGP